MNGKLKTLLTIAGSDPTGGAGIQADIKVAVSLGLHPLSVVTAVTAQNSRGLFLSGVLPSHFIKAQLKAVIQDVIPDAVKIGMIGSKDNIIVISDFLKNFCIPNNIPVVTDPVLKSSADNKLLVDGLGINELCDLYINCIFLYSTIITPNLYEFDLLVKNNNIIHSIKTSNLRNKSITDENDSLYKFAKSFHKKYTVIKGGHSDSDPIQDILISENDIIKFNHPRLNCMNIHGTGCVYSSLLACYLALGYSVIDAFKKANTQMEQYILKSCDYQLGDSIYGPLNINNYIYESISK